MEIDIKVLHIAYQVLFGPQLIPYPAADISLSAFRQQPFMYTWLNPSSSFMNGLGLFFLPILLNHLYYWIKQSNHFRESAEENQIHFVFTSSNVGTA